MKNITKAFEIFPKASVKVNSFVALFQAFAESFVDDYVEFTSMEVLVVYFMRVTRRSWKRAC